MCKVAICIPSYKNVKLLQRLLDSIFKQTFDDYIVVVSDDSDTDEVKLFTGQNYRDKVCYVKNRERLGATANCNNAMKYAQQFQPEYIKVMHHDDFFTFAESLDELVKLFEENPQAQMVFSGTCQVGEKNSFERYISDEQVKAIKNDIFYLFKGNVIGAPSAVMVKNEQIYMDNALKWLVDTEWYLRILNGRNQFNYTKKPLISIGVGDGQLTNSCIVDPQLQIWEHQYVYDKFPELHTKEYRKCLKNVLAKNRKQILKQRIKNFFVRSEK